MKRLTFRSEDIFEEIPGDPDNIMLKIPPEVLEHMGWKQGDLLDVTFENGSIVISKP
jgi:hypothetical protein